MKTLLAEKIVAAVKDVCGNSPAGLHEPRFEGNELNYLKECIDSTFVSSVGAFVDRFENQIAEFTGAKYAIAVVNGTAALQVSLIVSGVLPEDEVLVPALTFVATANAVAHCGAIPHFVDSCEDRIGIDPYALRSYLEQTTEMKQGDCINKNTGRVIRAIMPMHVFGHMIDMTALLDVADEFNLIVVEDAAEALGSYFQNKHAGTFGKLGALSFNGNKIITTGGGGAILTDDEGLAQKAKHITTTAKLPHAWEFRHDQVAFNYRMPNLNAAVGCAQLEMLPTFLKEKRQLYKRYSDVFQSISGASILGEPKDSVSNFWLQTLKLSKGNAAVRDEILNSTNHEGFMTRPIWSAMHTLPQFSKCPRMPLSTAESLEKRLINLPSSPILGNFYSE